MSDIGRCKSAEPTAKGLNMSANKRQARGKLQKGVGDLKEAVSGLKKAAKK